MSESSAPIRLSLRSISRQLSPASIRSLTLSVLIKIEFPELPLPRMLILSSISLDLAFYRKLFSHFALTDQLFPFYFKTLHIPQGDQRELFLVEKNMGHSPDILHHHALHTGQDFIEGEASPEVNHLAG